MAGRKATPKQDLIGTLKGILGLQPPPKKGKKKRRKGPPRPKPAAEPSFNEAYAQEAYGEDGSPFGDYAQDSGLGFDDHSYEAAAAAGYAPPAALDENEPELPGFGLQTAQATVPAPDDGKLFNMDALDSSLDALFSNLEQGQAPEEAPEGAPQNIVNFPRAAEKPAPKPAEPVAAPPPPIAPKAPVVEQAPEPKAAPQPVKPPAPVRPEPARWTAQAPTLPDVLPLGHGVDLRELLAGIDRAPGVAGSLIVGHDGLIIAATLPPAIDRDYLGAQACNLFTGNNQQSQKLGRGEVRRMVLETSKGVMLVTAADMGILVVVSEDGQAMDMPAVAGAIAGSLGQ